jgi:flavodoxin
MSTQPEEIINEIEEEEYVTEDEIEEGEIVTEDEDEDDELEDFDEDIDDGVDVPTLMTSLLATEEGDTVCTALIGIGQQLQVQNKILIKILAQLKN